MKTKLLTFITLLITAATLVVVFNATPAFADGESYKWVSADRIEGTGGSLANTSAAKSHNGIVTFIKTGDEYIGETKEGSCTVKLKVTVSDANAKGKISHNVCGRQNPIGALDSSFTIADVEKGPTTGDGSEINYATVNCSVYYEGGLNVYRCEAVKACIITAHKTKPECLAAWATCEQSFGDTFTEANRQFCQDKVGAGKFDEAVNPNKGDDTTRCAVEQIGWIVCPVTWFLSKMVDGAYSFVTSLLEVPPLVLTGGTKEIYNAWVIMRNFSNVAFVIAFLIIIFSQLTSVGISNYGIKKMLPRLIAAAILVNVSFWICAIAVDLSNIIGGSIYGLFENVERQVTVPNAKDFGADGTGWEAIAGGILVGGAAIGTALYVTLAALLPALVTALLAIVTVFLVLTLRQALIILLIVISPLAFVAFLLPNTESLFKKWRGLFQTLLLMYPIIAMIFGASALASKIIMATADSLPVKIMGALVAIIPLAITPLVLKTAGGVLNRFGGFVNNPNKGPFDRLKKGAEGYRDKRKDIAATRRLDGTNMFREGSKNIRGNDSSKFKRSRRALSGVLGTTAAVGERTGVQRAASWKTERDIIKENQAANAKKALAEKTQSLVAGKASVDELYAKKIAGPTGNVEDVIAGAQAVVRKEHGEAVERQQGKLRSEGWTNNQMVDMVRDESLSSIHREAAASQVLSNGRAQSVQDLVDVAGDLGTQRDDLLRMRPDDPAALEQAESLKDLLQTIAAGAPGSKGKPKVLSGTNLEELNAATFTNQVRDAAGNVLLNPDGSSQRATKMDQLVIKYLSDSKFSKEKVVSMDIDEITHLEKMATTGKLSALDPAQRSKIKSALDSLIGQPDPNDPNKRINADPLMEPKLESRQVKSLDKIKNIL